MIPCQLQQCRSLQRGISAATEGFFKAGGNARGAKIVVGGRHD